MNVCGYYFFIFAMLHYATRMSTTMCVFLENETICGYNRR